MREPSDSAESAAEILDRLGGRRLLDGGHALDRDYVELWAAEWEVLDRWQQAWTTWGAQ